MLKAKEIMSKTLSTVQPDQNLLEAMEILVCKEVSGLPVVNEEDELIGIITEKDILNFVFSGNLKTTRVREAMTKKVVSFSPDEDVDTIALAIGQQRFRRVPIVEGNKVVGIVSRRDILRSSLQIHCKI
jgi:CBS domain-containing protein